MPVDRPDCVVDRSSALDEEMELWKGKYLALKRKCGEYQRMNDLLFLRAKEIHRVIERAEAETRYLVKKLEQYEEVDFPRCLPSSRAETNGLRLHSSSTNPLLMSAAADRIRGEVEHALSREGERPSDKTVSKSQQSQSHSPRSGTNDRNQAENSVGTPGPPRLIHIPSPSPAPAPVKSPLGPPKAKKMKRTLKSAPEKPLKPGLKGAAAAKRRKGEIDPNAPKKPSNAFFWFCQARRAELQEQFKGEGTTGQHDLTKALAKLWGETTAEDKKPFYEQYALDKARYDHEMEEYMKSKQLSILPPTVPILTNQIADEGAIYTVAITNPEL